MSAAAALCLRKCKLPPPSGRSRYCSILLALQCSRVSILQKSHDYMVLKCITWTDLHWVGNSQFMYKRNFRVSSTFWGNYHTLTSAVQCCKCCKSQWCPVWPSTQWCTGAVRSRQLMPRRLPNWSERSILGVQPNCWRIWLKWGCCRSCSVSWTTLHTYSIPHAQPQQYFQQENQTNKVQYRT